MRILSNLTLSGYNEISDLVLERVQSYLRYDLTHDIYYPIVERYLDIVIPTHDSISNKISSEFEEYVEY